MTPLCLYISIFVVFIYTEYNVNCGEKSRKPVGTSRILLLLCGPVMPLALFVPPEIEIKLNFMPSKDIFHRLYRTQNPFSPLPSAHSSVQFCYSSYYAPRTLVAIKPLSGDRKSFRTIQEKDWNGFDY